MENKPRHQTTSIATGGTVEHTTSRPSLAGNPIKGAEHKFQPGSLKEAEFFRPCPPRGRCPWTGLSRTALIAAAGECGALVRLRQKHKLRGALLIHRETLTNYLRSLATDGKGVE
jgi:hypothetical protein